MIRNKKKIELSKERKEFLRKIKKQKIFIITAQIILIIGFISIWEIL